MAFEALSERLQNIFSSIGSKSKVTQSDIEDAMREVRLAFLEADVNFKIVKDFVKRVSEKALGEKVLNSLTPSQQVIKIVHDELVELMGVADEKLVVSSKPPTIYMMVGLQGAGKTTATAKLANFIRKKGKKPLLVACDIYRPAAIKQLQVLGKSLDIPVFEMGDNVSPVEIAKNSIEYANKYFLDTIILDTAGRLQIDDDLMNELVSIKEVVNLSEILLVIDSMTGQEAVNVASTFNEKLDITGVILTKLDGDARGGAALSVRAATGKPIKFVGVGEKISDLQVFHPDRMASRILGMGDVLSLIEKAQETIDSDEALKIAKKMKDAEFDLNDFLSQLQQMKKMGPLKDILKMLPGVNSQMLDELNIDDKHLIRIEAIIQSMTLKERENPKILNASRRKRIALGSGTEVSEVNKLMKQFEEMQKFMKVMKKGSKKGMRGMRDAMRGMNFPF